MTPQELKDALLQRAIQGKLVPQDPKEGTGEELLRQIRLEKEKLISEGKIKKEKPLPEIKDDEKPFEIPAHWTWARLVDCGSWGAGATPSRMQPEYYGGNIPWLKTGDLNDGYISKVPETITELALNKTSVRLNPVGSVLMAMYGATIGKLGILTVPMTTNQACCACVPFSLICNKYLFYFLMSNRASFIGRSEGGAQPNISKEKIICTPFPLPPLGEQKRIVAKLESLKPFVERYARAKTRLDEISRSFPDDLRRGLLQRAIEGRLVARDASEGTGADLLREIQKEKQALIASGKIKKEKPLPEIKDDEKPFEIPEHWTWTRLKDVVIKITDGTHRSPPNGEVGDFLYITAKNIKERGVLLDNVSYVSQKVHSEIYGRCNPEKGDVLLIKDGATTGVVTVNNVDRQFSMLSSVALIKTSNGLDSWFLTFVLRSNLLYQTIRGQMKGTGITRITLRQIEPLIIPLPPLGEQKRIVAKLEALLPLCDRLTVDRR